MRQVSLFESERLTMQDAIELTAQSLAAYGNEHRDWVIAYSGGKDSTTLATLVPYLIEQGHVAAPQSLTLLYADTGMELPPLTVAAHQTLQHLAARNIDIIEVLPPLDNRFFVYMFGRGVPPPTNHARWCTRMLKADPMDHVIHALAHERGTSSLMLTGVRVGESAARDQRIALACSNDDGECGQGWFHNSRSIPTLAPILHWRACHISDWLQFYAPFEVGIDTTMLFEAYGIETDEASFQEMSTRTGCVGCNLVEKDTALEKIVALPQWNYLAPLLRLKALYGDLRKPKHRLRKAGIHRLKDGSMPAKPMRMGPLTMEARRMGMQTVLDIQAEVNAAAREQGRPEYVILRGAEVQRINELIDANTWPIGWDGTEPLATEQLPEVYSDGVIQPILVYEQGT